MADQAQTPPSSDAAAPVSADVQPAAEAADHEPVTVVDDHRESVQVRRAPKYSVFLILGAVIGIVVAMILTFAFNTSGELSPNTGLVYSQGQVFGFLALICVSAGVVLAAVVALIFDRALSRRTRSFTADRARIHIED